jgi:hypothetical protein
MSIHFEQVDSTSISVSFLAIHSVDRFRIPANVKGQGMLRLSLILRRLFVVMVVLTLQTVSFATPPRRLLAFNASSRASADAWRQRTRTTLFALLNVDDLVVANWHDADGQTKIDLKPTVLASERLESFTRKELEIDSRPDRRIKVVLTIPDGAKPRATPAVVCIHGHGGNRNIVYTADSPYHAFAATLACSGYVTLSTDVGQHMVQDENRSLMGERLWDLIRVVDLAVAMPEVDPQRIGCAGLSLGGEMAMWLGAMDTRVSATVSSGFLTTMENLREGHCMCWDFPGLQRRWDFADIYSLISPRPLQCQNGLKEKLPGGFPVDLAEPTMSEIQRAYAVDGQKDAVELAIHPAGHVFDVPSAVRFLDAALIVSD